MKTLSTTLPIGAQGRKFGLFMALHHVVDAVGELQDLYCVVPPSTLAIQTPLLWPDAYDGTFRRNTSLLKSLDICCILTYILGL